jgi:hypothetical protein
MSTPTVFISYSHDSREHADRVLALANRLREDGIDCILDQYEESPQEGWTMWMDRHIKNDDFVLMVCTEKYYRRVMGEEKASKGLGVKWEGKLVYQHIYRADSTNTRFIPVLLAADQISHIPTPLQDATYYCVDTEAGYETLYRRLSHRPVTIKPDLGKLRTLPPRERKQDFFQPKISLAKLPTTGKDLFGREAELQMLDDAWTDPHRNILSLVAWGGVGKTALVNEWLNRMELDNYRGAERVYGWSFYSQGTREDKQASADTFFEDALAWFGYQGEPLKSPWEKGKELAQLIKQHKTLLILDGLEPLQYPPGEQEGVLRDQGLQALLKDLARFNPGLCVITTRSAIADLENFVDKSTKRVLLENLSPQAGRQLLREAGVTKGTDKELESASIEYGGHALALNLLGKYIAVRFGGEIRERDKIKKLTYEKDKQGKHARNVMHSYEIWLQGTPELDLLYIMGLFDRPVPLAEIEALKQKPVIKDLTDSLQRLSDEDWDFMFQHLRDLRLLAEKDEHRPDSVDCHPLIREHFGEKLKANNPKAWQEAHSRLYKYYKSPPQKEYPDTLEEMEPLFAAVAHGCQAGDCTKVWEEVFWTRIRRGNEYYIYRKLGAFGSDLAALSNFFKNSWSKPTDEISEQKQALVLSQAGFCLRALGRLREAAQPLQADLEMAIKQKDCRGCAQEAGNLSELYLTLGDVLKAVAYALQSVNFADRSGNGFQKYSKRTTLADAQHQAGELAAVEQLFQEAESLQQQRQPEYRYLYSLRGFQFCDLLLSQGKVREVLERAKQTIDIAINNKRLLDIALDKLSLGRAYFLQAQSEGKNDYKQAADYLNAAVAGLRDAGQQDDLPRGLFACAFLYRVQNEFSRAWDDLVEAYEIAERGSMGLWLADYPLEAARLCLAEGKTEDAAGHLTDAKRLVAETGYHRRDPEVLVLEAQVCFAQEDKEQAREWLVKAKKRFDEMGIREWDFEVAELERKLRG